MCPKGHELWVGGGAAAALRWRWHARGCAPCREVYRAEAFIGAYLGEAGRWPVEAVPRTRQRWRLVLAAAIVGVLVVPLLWPVMTAYVRAAQWRQEVASFRNPVAATAEGRRIYTIHYVQETKSGLVDGWWETCEVSRKYPDQERIERRLPTGVSPAWSLSTRDGDRRLAQTDPEVGGYAVEEGGESFQCRLDRASEPIMSPDAFTETGVAEAGLVGSLRFYPHLRRDEIGEDVLKHYVEESNGVKVYVTEHRLAKVPSYLGCYRTFVDPSTHLVTGWEYQITGVAAAAAMAGTDDSYHEIVTQVEYNVDLPVSLFSTRPPDGATILDCYSPQGMKLDYDVRIEGMQRERKAADPETWAQAIDIWNDDPALFPHVNLLDPKDQAEIRAKLKGLGIER